MRILAKYLAALVGSVIVVGVIVGITRASFNLSPPRTVDPPPPAAGSGYILVRLAAANTDAGLALRPRCVTCHTFEPNGPNRVGPNLWNIVGRDKGSAPGFPYSEAMRSAPGTWTFEELDRFLAAPAQHTPGTRMNYAGLPAAGDRANLIAYLRTLSTAPAPLPQ